jgi:glycyl-tRNA synthetase
MDTKKDTNSKTSEEFRKELIAFVQQKGFVWGPSPEIYGGISGFYTYAPLGKLLKNNIEHVIKRVFQKNNFWEVECPTVMQKEVWEASGHLGGFSDPIIACTKCKATFRADNLIEEFFPDTNTGNMDEKALADFISKNNIKCPSCKSTLADEVKRHNLMMKTTIGLDIEAYNRPETATTTYLPFLRYVDFFRKKLPFGVFQIGKAYRNEISPRQYMLRMREFTQAEAQLMIFKDDKNNYDSFELIKNEKMPLWTAKTQEDEKSDITKITVEQAFNKGHFKNKAYASSVYLAYNLFREMGIPSEKIRMRQHMSDEKAFYADDAWDVEIELNSFGWTEVCGVHDRTDYDLTQHGKHSGKDLVAQTPDNKKEIPHVIEIAFGVDRPLFALLDIFYDKKEKDQGKTMFKVPYHMAPIKAAVYPLMKKEGMPQLAKEVYDNLSEDFVCVYDESGAIGRRYLRSAEQGTPFSITIDFDSITNKDCTIRDRDSEKQARIKISELNSTIKNLLKNKLSFDDLNIIEK